MRSIRTTTAKRAVAATLLAAVLAAPAVPRPALAQQEEPDPHRQTIVGGAVGALGGAVLGRLLAGKHNNTAAVLGGAILGGLAGGAYGYNRERQGAGGAQAASDYDRQSDLQRRAATRQDEEKKLVDGWKDHRTAAALARACRRRSGRRKLPTWSARKGGRSPGITGTRAACRSARR